MVHRVSYSYVLTVTLIIGEIIVLAGGSMKHLSAGCVRRCSCPQLAAADRRKDFRRWLFRLMSRWAWGPKERAKNSPRAPCAAARRGCRTRCWSRRSAPRRRPRSLSSHRGAAPPPRRWRPVPPRASLQQLLQGARPRTPGGRRAPPRPRQRRRTVWRRHRHRRLRRGMSVRGARVPPGSRMWRAGPLSVGTSPRARWPLAFATRARSFGGVAAPLGAQTLTRGRIRRLVYSPFVGARVLET